jgi:hypothetical protein
MGGWQGLYRTLGWNIDFPMVCGEPLKSIRFLRGVVSRPLKRIVANFLQGQHNLFTRTFYYNDVKTWKITESLVLLQSASNFHRKSYHALLCTLLKIFLFYFSKLNIYLYQCWYAEFKICKITFLNLFLLMKITTFHPSYFRNLKRH